MFGAERLLMQRCKDEEIFNKTVNLINITDDPLDSLEYVPFATGDPAAAFNKKMAPDGLFFRL